MTQPLASLSLDLDNKWSYLKTHGDRGWESFPSYLDRVVPRCLDELDKLGLSATFFIVGQDAAIEHNHATLRSISAAGHEIGNHSFHHEPWLHLYSPDEIEDEISAAEEAIESATGVMPRGFRGPGYSQSPAVLWCLSRRGYQYDASTLPSILGPLARAYYFFTARLSPEERRQRRRLFGGISEGFRPLRPYWWQFGERASGALAPPARLLEIPVTTLPLFRVPIHFSYLLFLRQFSAAAAWSYWRMAMRLCRLSGVEPSLLLHPLDFLGGDEEPDLSFFPAMGMAGQTKREFLGGLLADLAHRFRVLPLGRYAAIVSQRASLLVRRVLAETNSRSRPAARLPPQSEAALTAELIKP
jgi:peptidoglycan-N-acetylglucosamine deacetylase